MYSRAGLSVVLAAMAALGCGTSPGAPKDVCGDRLVDLKSEVENCGSCGNECTKPRHAVAACNAGSCGAGACDAGWGGDDCGICLNGRCTAALPDTGAVFQAIASGSSYGEKEQFARAGHSNVAVMGEPTPPSADKRFVTQSNAQHVNVSGLNAALH